MLSVSVSFQIGAEQAAKAARHPTKCDVINDLKIFLTVYGKGIYCRKSLTSSNQTSHYKIKYIRVFYTYM